MKKFLLLLLLASGLFAQTPLYLFDSPVKGNAVSQNGSNQYEYVAPTLRMTGSYSLVDNFSDGNYNGWTVSSGAYTVDNAIANPLSANQYSLVCNTAGVISIPCNQAYGIWKFQVYKNADANAINVFFMNSTGSLIGDNGYLAGINSSEAIATLVKRTNGSSSVLGASGSFYISNTTWYEITIERNTNGQFYTYITGGAFTTKTLVSVTGGSGSNPVTDNTYTSSNYFVLDLDAGDRISNISCEYGEGSLDLNSYEMSKYSFDRDFEVVGYNWAGNGNHSLARSTTDKKTGTYSLAITSSASGDATTNYASLASTYFNSIEAGKKYTLEGYARGTGILGSATYTSNFSSTTDGWQAGGSSSVAIASNELVLTSTGTNGYVFRNTTQTLNTEYEISFTARIGSGSKNGAQLSLHLDFNNYPMTALVNPNITTSNQTYVFRAKSSTTSSTSIAIRVPTNIANGDVIYFSNITVKPVALPSITFACGSQTKTFTNISCVPGTFTKLVWNFQATSAEVGQPIKFWANQADIIYYDDFSVTQAYDLLEIVWLNSSQNSVGIVTTNGGSGANSGIRFICRGDQAGDYVTSGTNDIGGNTIINSQSPNNVINGSWNMVATIRDRTGNQTTYLNGVAGSPASMLTIGKVIGSNPLYIGQDVAGTNKFAGLIGEVQITRFKDIAQSNVNASTLLSAKQIGLPKNWVNGIPVFNVKFRGTTLTQAGYDYSGAGNHLTFVNVTIADIIFGQGYNIK